MGVLNALGATTEILGHVGGERVGRLGNCPLSLMSISGVHILLLVCNYTCSLRIYLAHSNIF